MDLTLGLGRKPRIAVVGDVMLDVAVHGSCTKLANEAPIPVFRERGSRRVALGGCGNVAANLAAMGCDQLYLFSRVGDDAAGEQIRHLCDHVGINTFMIEVEEFPTITKTRYYADKTLLFRHDEEIVEPLEAAQEERILAGLRSLIPTIDCVVLSDYAKGFLTESLCQAIIAICNEFGVSTIVDPKGYATKYHGCTLIKPNRVELKALFGIGTEDMAAAHARVAEVVGCAASCITLSEDGMSLAEKGAAPIYRRNRRAEVIDVTGAGDVVCATLAYMWPLVADRAHILEVANNFAMVSVGHLGSYVLQTSDFLIGHKLRSIDEVAAATAGKRVVFTNGCFDILHAGHLGLLKECAQLGDLVVVGLNSDASVARLKGPTRPIHSAADRAAALAALDWVSYIVVFKEDTPASLLQVLRPAVLVKGGDYKADEVIGREYANEVVIVPTLAGHSTTRTVNLIRG